MKRALIWTCTFAIAAATGFAADTKTDTDKPKADKTETAKSSVLKPKQVEEGWIMLFDGETTFGWKVEGDVKVTDGVLVLGGEGKEAAIQTTTAFGDFELMFYSRTSDNEKAKLVLNGQALDIPKHGSWAPTELKVESTKDACKMVGTFLKGGAKQFIHADKPAPSRTPIEFKVAAGCTLELRRVILKPLGLKSIFNGKDLTGWKEIPDKQSKFTVTDKGEINVKNGGGDLQSEGQWQDFVLQLDVISNGDHLNSGVFFRAVPGRFWSGYESQVRNQWEGDDRTKPVDYGTGGLYNLQPTRKVLPSDREWFTNTVIAQGAHFAIWINGYQTADYVDVRPPADSGRKGTMTGKGVISLQGHDPTTDLSFRNIRVVEIPQQQTK